MSTYLIAGVVASIAGLFVFLVIHHFWIMPIWFILPPGLIIAVLGGLAVGWSYFEIQAGLPPRPWTALVIAALIALILAPAILIAELRSPLISATTFSISPGEGPRVAARFFLELIVTAMLVGASLGWLLGHSSRAALATALAGVAFALGPGHNIPLLGGTPSAGKGVLLLAAIILVSSIVLVEGTAFLSRR
jgi:hypothetical protein